MPDELIDIFDENNGVVVEKKMKNIAHSDGSWHRVAHIWMFNNKKEVLLQLRSKDKASYPDMWDISCAGHVSAGEEVITSALRELSEEVGLVVEESHLLFWKVYPKKAVYKELINNEFFYIYFLQYNGRVEDICVQVEEVQKVQFFSIEQIRNMLKNTPEKLVPHGVYWEEILQYIENI